MQVKINDLSKEQILKGIGDGSFLTDDELGIVSKGRELDQQDTDAMTDAYRLLRQLSENPEHGDPDETIDMCEIRDTMYEYAYSNGLEFDSSSGQFWEPSSC